MTEQTFSPGVRAAFLAELARHGIIGKAAAAVGVSRSTVDRYRREFPEFAEQYAEALENGIDQIEDAGFDRAVNGVERAVYHRGEQVGTEIHYSDAVLMFLLERKRYKNTVRTELATPDGPLQVTDPAKKASMLEAILNRARVKKDAADLT